MSPLEVEAIMVRYFRLIGDLTLILPRVGEPRNKTHLGNRPPSNMAYVWSLISVFPSES